MITLVSRWENWLASCFPVNVGKTAVCQNLRLGILSNKSLLYKLSQRSRIVTKPTKWHVLPAKTQISLGIRPVWSESSLCAQLVAKDPSFLQADSEDSDQTGRMPRLIWVFAGRTCHFVGFVTMRLKWYFIKWARSVMFLRYNCDCISGIILLHCIKYTFLMEWETKKIKHWDNEHEMTLNRTLQSNFPRINSHVSKTFNKGVVCISWSRLYYSCHSNE